jgi:hypothetical protein
MLHRQFAEERGGRFRLTRPWSPLSRDRAGLPRISRVRARRLRRGGAGWRCDARWAEVPGVDAGLGSAAALRPAAKADAKTNEGRRCRRPSRSPVRLPRPGGRSRFPRRGFPAGVSSSGGPRFRPRRRRLGRFRWVPPGSLRSVPSGLRALPCDRPRFPRFRTSPAFRPSSLSRPAPEKRTSQGAFRGSSPRGAGFRRTLEGKWVRLLFAFANWRLALLPSGCPDLVFRRLSVLADLWLPSGGAVSWSFSPFPKGRPGHVP